MRAATARAEGIEGMQTRLARGGQTRSGLHDRERLRDAQRSRLVFMLAVLGGGQWLYGALGGSGTSLAAALTYSNVVFSGALLVWIFNALANVIRGTGNMALPATARAS